MSTRQYVFTPKVSLKPNQVTLYNDVCFSTEGSDILRSIHEGQSRTPIEKQFHNFTISRAAQKNIVQKVQWLYLLGKSSYKKTYSGTEIFNFKINFLTLTLPSAQKHNTAKITNECFNHFLTEIRQRTQMQNYVWRLEFQKNGNVHYHIVTDMYIDYFMAQKIWNRIINKLGYVDAYTRKFEKMTLQDYVKTQSNYHNATFDILAKRYAKGRAVKWKEPRSVDVKVCTNNKSIAHYIAKYFSKDSDSFSICNPLDNEDNSFGLRLWFCSRSLSKLKSITDYSESMKINWHWLLLGKEKVRSVVMEYAHCLYFDIRNLSNDMKALLYPTFRAYANEQGYNSA